MLAIPPLLGIVAAAVTAPVDPYGGGGVRWGPALAAAWASLRLAAGVCVGAVLCGGLAAWAEARWKGTWVAVLAAAATLPLVVPSYVLAATLSRTWAAITGTPAQGLLAATVVLILSTAPLVQLVVGAALRRQPAAEAEVARSLGASPQRIFAVVHWPRLRPALGLGGLLAALYAVSDFGAVAVLDAPVLTWRMYDAVVRVDMLRAAVLGALAFAVVVPLAIAAWTLRGDVVTDHTANPRPVPPGPGPTQGLVVFGVVATMVAVLGIGVPVATLLSWVGDGLSRGLPFAALGGPVRDTLLAAAGGATLVTVLALGPALAGRDVRVLEGGVYGASVLPGLLVAFGWLGAALALARYAGADAYQALLSSGVLLGLAYAARFLAEVHAPLRAGALRLDPRHRLAAATLGVGFGGYLRRIALPELSPSIRTAWLLGFLVMVKELPITLILGAPAGLQTLSFRVWDRHSEALWHDAGAAGLVLVGLAAVGRWWLSRD